MFEARQNESLVLGAGDILVGRGVSGWRDVEDWNLLKLVVRVIVFSQVSTAGPGSQSKPLGKALQLTSFNFWFSSMRRVAFWSFT